MNITVRDLMSVQFCSVENTASFREVLKLLLREGISEIYVTDHSGRLLGTVADYSLLKGQLSRTANDVPAISLMSRNVTTVDPDSPVLEIASIFRESRYRRVAVVEDGRLVGHLERRDLMRYLCVHEAVEESTDDATTRDETESFRTHHSSPAGSTILPAPKHPLTQQRSAGTLQSR